MRRPLLIAHDLSYSGAPVALLALARGLRRLGESPVVAPLAGGPLGAKFVESGIEVATRVDRANVSFVIANTVLAVPTALRFKRFDTPVAAWLHESTYFFRLLNIAPQDSGLRDLDVVLGPARFQLVELEPFLRPGSAYQMRNTVCQDFFRPPGDESMVAVCGQWEARKGQAQLLDLARRSAVGCRFKFIGAEQPAGHGGAGALPSPHMFLGPIEPDMARKEIATSGALVSCAESEVQPLSAIEALMAGRPVLLSDIAAHRALADRVPNVFLFDRKSPGSFSEGYRKLCDAMGDVPAASNASAIAKALFGEAAFDRRLVDIIQVLRGDAASSAGIEHYQDS